MGVFVLIALCTYSTTQIALCTLHYEYCTMHIAYKHCTMHIVLCILHYSLSTLCLNFRMTSNKKTTSNMKTASNMKTTSVAPIQTQQPILPKQINSNCHWSLLKCHRLLVHLTLLGIGGPFQSPLIKRNYCAKFCYINTLLNLMTFQIKVYGNFWSIFIIIFWGGPPLRALEKKFKYLKI